MAITDNLIAYWKLDGNSNDSLGVYNGTDTSITYNTSYGKINQGALFGGVNSKINIGTNTNLNITGDMSISFWVYNSSSTTSWNTPIARRNDNQTVAAYGINFNHEVFQWYFRDNTTYRICAVAERLPLYTWTHVIVTRESGVHKVYWNNVLKATTDLSSYTVKSAPSAETLIGADYGTNAYAEFLVGYEDEIGIWNRALTETERNTIYNNGVGVQYPFSINTGSFLLMF